MIEQGEGSGSRNPERKKEDFRAWGGVTPERCFGQRIEGIQIPKMKSFA